ncbi:hypothetical protein BDD12DRAFT_259754 [Trichophaea hybrida]|nr:hypothetical protein BDD12DRAFT_259754 [Trichophaea hybrida]
MLGNFSGPRAELSSAWIYLPTAYPKTLSFQVRISQLNAHISNLRQTVKFIMQPPVSKRRLDSLIMLKKPSKKQATAAPGSATKKKQAAGRKKTVTAYEVGPPPALPPPKYENNSQRYCPSNPLLGTVAPALRRLHPAQIPARFCTFHYQVLVHHPSSELLDAGIRNCIRHFYNRNRNHISPISTPVLCGIRKVHTYLLQHIPLILGSI